MNPTFYLDWTFWAFFVSAIALTLSQLPPIKTWFKKGKIDSEVYPTIKLTQKIGNPNLTINLYVRNTGGKRLRIKEINIALLKQGQIVANLPAKTYHPDPLISKDVLFTSFSLNPGDEWANEITCFNFFSREEESKYRTLESKLIAGINLQRKLYKEEHDEESPLDLEGDPETVAHLHKFFDEKFIWEDGEYRLDIALKTDDQKSHFVKSYRFTIFESQSEILKKSKEGIKFGYGVYLDRIDLTSPNAIQLDIVEI